jgi:hypothetical protein
VTGSVDPGVRRRREFITHNAGENYETLAQNRVGIAGASEKNYNKTKGTAPGAAPQRR